MDKGLNSNVYAHLSTNYIRMSLELTDTLAQDYFNYNTLPRTLS
ncbi:hypothetical protein HMPREF1863_01051 [Aedoeadaptatus coxii]|uniref:Uncharacterized protein n=1 Tax=Aedoeadaptatus coxii TaxID=755172 RepID=A0A134AG49_9FIRM|nr:hypothetical protein HMPREF1863_01051 [Peptoniphilus coxii]